MAKVSTASVPASGLVRFSVGENEVTASVALGAGIRGQAGAMEAFLRDVIVTHNVSLADCLAPMAERKAGNGMGQAQYEFVRMCFGIAIFGAEMTKRILSTKTTDETVLDFAGAVSFKTGAAIKPNTARYVMQNQLGKDFGEFLVKLKMLQDGLDATPRGPSAKYTDMTRIAKMLNAAIKVCRKDADKADGSIDTEVAAKFAKFLADGMKSFNVKE
jgi:hypothetical protein